MTMTDSQNQAQISEERERRLKQIDKKKERFLKQYEEQKERHLKLMREYYALNLDALKVMGGGNAAGLVAAAAALKNFPDVGFLIKIAGAIFLLGVFCYAIGYFFLFSFLSAANRLPGIAQREIEKIKESIAEASIKEVQKTIDNQAAEADRHLPGAIRSAMLGSFLFFVGCILGFIILIWA